MKKPAVVAPTDVVTQVGQVFSTSLVVKGKTWFPLVQLAAWPVMAWVAKRRAPGRSWSESMIIGALTMPIVLGSEWGHNLAHAAAARLVGKPMDAIRITWGMPLCVYYDINDRDTSPRQHIARALGGPVFNMLVLLAAFCFRRRTAPGSLARDLADAAVRTNAFLPAVGLLPIPGIDGGPVLKWSLVAVGRTPQEADRVVRKVDGVLVVLLGVAGMRALMKKRWLTSGLFLSLGAAALGVASGLLEER